MKTISGFKIATFEYKVTVDYALWEQHPGVTLEDDEFIKVNNIGYQKNALSNIIFVS